AKNTGRKPPRAVERGLFSHQGEEVTGGGITGVGEGRGATNRDGNKHPTAFSRCDNEARLAEAILDRLLERGAHIAMRRRSYRIRHLREEDCREPPANPA